LGKLAFEEARWAIKAPCSCLYLVYGETPILAGLGGHQAFAKTTEAATVSGTQNLSLTLVRVRLS
jgi:hypothetical protein